MLRRSIACVGPGVIADHGKRFFARFAIRHDVVGPVEVASVALVDRHELLDVEGVRAFNPDRFDLLRLDLDILALGDS